MQIIGEHDSDVMMDEYGQPVSDGKGDTDIVSDDSCWLQDMKNDGRRRALL